MTKAQLISKLLKHHGKTRRTVSGKSYAKKFAAYTVAEIKEVLAGLTSAPRKSKKGSKKKIVASSPRKSKAVRKTAPKAARETSYATARKTVRKTWHTPAEVKQRFPTKQSLVNEALRSGADQIKQMVGPHPWSKARVEKVRAKLKKMNRTQLLTAYLGKSTWSGMEEFSLQELREVLMVRALREAYRPAVEALSVDRLARGIKIPVKRTMPTKHSSGRKASKSRKTASKFRSR